MSDDTDEETPPPASSFHGFKRKITYLVGIFFLIWMVLAKNIPSIFSPHASPVVSNSEPAHKTNHNRAAPVVIDEPAETEPVAAVPPPPPPPDEHVHIAHLEEQAVSLKSDIANLDEKFNQYRKLVDNLESRLDAMQGNGTRQLAAITAFSVMKEAVMRGEPFDNEFKQLGNLVRDPEQKKLLAPLESYAKSGMITVAELKNQFDKILPSALSKHNGDSITGRLQSLILIRKEGEQQQGNDDEAILARAEAKIDHGEIAEALKEVQALTPLTATAFADWDKNAHTYLEGHSALNALQMALLQADTKAEPKPGGK